MSPIATITEFFQTVTAQQAAVIGRELAAEWLEAHPSRMLHLYTDEQLMWTWLNFAGGVILGCYGFGNDHNLETELDQLCAASEAKYQHHNQFRFV
jgi:hypothetical protein